MALNSKFSFENWPRAGSDDYITEDLIRFLREPQTLVPGARKRVVWRADGTGRTGSSEPAIGFPDGRALKLTYSDELEKQYQTEISFNLSVLGAATPVPQEGPRSTGTQIDEKKSLADINHALRTLNVHVGELRR
jgi:hypothetical protein